MNASFSNSFNFPLHHCMIKLLKEKYFMYIVYTYMYRTHIGEYIYMYVLYLITNTLEVNICIYNSLGFRKFKEKPNDTHSHTHYIANFLFVFICKNVSEKPCIIIIIIVLFV